MRSHSSGENRPNITCGVVTSGVSETLSSETNLRRMAASGAISPRPRAKARCEAPPPSAALLRRTALIKPPLGDLGAVDPRLYRQRVGAQRASLRRLDPIAHRLLRARNADHQDLD